MNNIVKNAIAAQGRAVAKNALTVEDQRANEEDKKKLREEAKKKMREAVKAIDAKGAKLAQKIQAYYVELERLGAKQKNLQQEVMRLQNEGSAVGNLYVDKEYIYPADDEVSDLLTALSFAPNWTKLCRYNKRLYSPGVIQV